MENNFSATVSCREISQLAYFTPPWLWVMATPVQHGTQQVWICVQYHLLWFFHFDLFIQLLPELSHPTSMITVTERIDCNCLLWDVATKKHSSGVIREQAHGSNASGLQGNNVHYWGKNTQPRIRDTLFLIIFLYEEKMSISAEQWALYWTSDEWKKEP